MINVQEYLSKKGYQFSSVQRPSGLNLIMNCPFCEDQEKKFAINADTGAYKCLHENTCGRQGSFTDFQRELGDIPEQLRNPGFIPKKKKVYQKPKVHTQKVYGKVLDWLHDRKITDNAISQFKLGQKDDHTLMIPSYKDAELVNVKYRTLDKKMWSEKNTEPVLFNRDNSTGKDTLTICEGELDCIALAIYGVNAVSVPNGTNDLRWIENEFEWLQQFTKIYLLMDSDTAGQKAVLEIVSRLGKWRCYNVLLPCKDANECLVEGIPAEKIISCIDNSKGFELENLKTAGYFTDEIIKLNNDDSHLYGIKTPFEGLDKLLKGFRETETTIITGNNGAGKSTFENQIIIDLARKNQKSCIASLEMPAVRYLRWAVVQAAKYQFLDDTEIKRVLNWLDEYLFIVDTTSEITPDALLDVWEFAARKHGVKFFFLDSLMRISFPYKDEYTEQKKFMSRLLSFGKEHNAHIFIVAHPRKAATDSYQPGKVDIAGTGNISNLAHNVLMLWRVPEEMKKKAAADGKNVSDTVLYLKKNREWGLEGKIPLSFNPERKLFTEIGGF